MWRNEIVHVKISRLFACVIFRNKIFLFRTDRDTILMDWTLFSFFSKTKLKYQETCT